MKKMLSNKEQNSLVETAIDIRPRAYAPYSNYSVGAALLTKSGQIFSGVNVENAAYPTTMCAERVAVFKAVSEGKKEFKAIAVATENGGSPCGSCRQVLSEFGLDIIVLIVNGDGEIIKKTTVSDLLPGAFTPQHLNQ
jgi:cytidine deaminase